MTFISINEEKRTFDAERGFELLTNGGGNEGSRHFILRGPDIQLHFSGLTSSAAIEGVDPRLHASVSKTLIWHVYNQPLPIPGQSMEETRQLITEALTAFKGVHGYPAGQAVSVEFPRSLEGML